MSAARRSLLTATAAGTLLCALWFVPSANATAEHDTTTGTTAPTAARQQSAPAATTENLSLADTGSVDTTPYVVGGTAFLAIGAAFVAYSTRRTHITV
ncbi:hypothetical protein GCM10020367_40040 [Streptomyces sannanensis]|uniref:LPXTG cell wall anchor domain-containing protein n=1 Tax=Streptomyces sannanensis TaxID=285536 RepID=A0ABP6SET4_9ACTN